MKVISIYLFYIQFSPIIYKSFTLFIPFDPKLDLMLTSQTKPIFKISDDNYFSSYF
jgi:hypothetical protein